MVTFYLFIQARNIKREVADPRFLSRQINLERIGRGKVTVLSQQFQIRSDVKIRDRFVHTFAEHVFLNSLKYFFRTLRYL